MGSSHLILPGEDAALLPSDSLLLHLEHIRSDHQSSQRLIQGQRLPLAAHGAQGLAGLVRLYRPDGQLLRNWIDR
jgi:hypothetical protein